ncbi:unnamed protein product, partial [marine sediment metagenome]
ALYENVDGDYNIGIGYEAGRGAAGQSHSNNIFVGRKTGKLVTTGGNNICIGYQAGDVITTGTDNILIGYDIDPSAAGATHEINIGGVYKGDVNAVTANIAGALTVDGTIAGTNLTLTAGGTTKWVAPGAGTLSAAVAAADDGDCLHLMAGTYTETASDITATADRSLSIIGSGPEVSIIECDGHNGIVIDNSGGLNFVTLKDFSIKTKDTTKTGIQLEGCNGANCYKQFHVDNVFLESYTEADHCWLDHIKLIE